MDNIKITKGWWLSEIPGYRGHLQSSTYNYFSYEELPPIAEPSDNFVWLKSQPKVNGSMHDNGYSDGTMPDLSKLDAIEVSLNVSLPTEFREFIKSPDLHQRMRSNTDCYFDVHDRAVRTHGMYDGYLIHFLSDSQWCLHWYLELLDTGEHFIVVSTDAYGLAIPTEFQTDVNETDYKNLVDLAEESEIVYCANSFKEFIYRFWLENEIWYALVWDVKPLNSEQLHYVNHYKK